MYKIDTERSHLFDVNIMILMQITVSGRAGEAELTEAFRDTVKAFEILNTKITIDENGTASYTPCSDPQNSINFRSFELEDLVREQERLRFKLENGEFLRCFARLSDNGMTLAFAMHHLGGDGKSLCYFIEAFLRRLNGEKLEYRKAVIFKGSALPAQEKLPLVIDLLVKSYNKKWQKERRTFTFEDLDHAYAQFWKDRRTTLTVTRTESTGLTEKLKECKSAGIGFTSYTIAEMIRSIPAPQDVGLAVDARLDGNRTMSNQATGITVKHKFNKAKSLIENARIIDGLMKKKLRDDKKKYFVLRFFSAVDPTLLDAVVLESSGQFRSKTSAKFAALIGYGNKKRDLSVTNLTRVDIPTDYGRFTLEDLVFVPPVISSAQNVVGMATVNGRLTTAFHRYE